MSLDVYLHGRAIGKLSSDGRRGYRFAYAPEVVREVGEGEMLLSGTMPVSAEPFEHREARHYIEGLLPEGARREAIEAALGLEPGDDFSLIAELGRDCPGATVFIPEGEEPPVRPSDSPPWLTDAELEELLRRPEAFLEDGESDGRFALPGKRHKLALVRDEAEDRWALPGLGAPSTHVVKPQPAEMPDFAINEVACTEAMRRMGLPVAHAELAEIAGTPCVVSKRFDRWGEGTGAARLHSENLRQALGSLCPPRLGEPGAVMRTCQLLRALGEEGAVETLCKVDYCRKLLGNGDHTHATNTALIYTEGGALLAPFYDICSESVHEIDGNGGPGATPPARPLASVMGLAIPSNMETKDAMILAITAHFQFCTSLNEVAEQAQAEDWHSPVIEKVLLRMMSSFKLLGEEIEEMREHGGRLPLGSLFP